MLVVKLVADDLKKIILILYGDFLCILDIYRVKLQTPNFMKNFRFLYFIPIFILTFCNSTNNNMIDILTPPVILVIKSDSVIIVEGSNGKRYTVNSIERVDYRTAFLNVGDTLNLE